MCLSVLLRSVLWIVCTAVLGSAAAVVRPAGPVSITVTDLTAGGLDGAEVRHGLQQFIGIQQARWAKELPEVLDVTVTTGIKERMAGGVPDWGAGFAIPHENRIIIINDPRRNQPRFGLQETMRHETVHILFHRVIGSRKVPRWFEEGFAMTAAGEWRFGYDVAITRARLTGSLLGLGEIDRVLGFPDARAQLAYAQSFAAFRLLVKQTGIRTIYTMIPEIGRYGFAAAFIRATAMTPDMFEERYRHDLDRRYGIWRVLLDSSLYWLGLTGLFLAAYFINRVRTRKKLRQWEEEEMIVYAHPE